MRFDLKTPCKNCPFRTDETRITFSGTERATEIAEQAYRRGFPCHLSAEHREDEEDGDGGGYYAGENSQHCAGAIIMLIKDGHDSWPGVDNDEDLVDRLRGRMNFDAPVFDSEQEFIEANAEQTQKRRRRS